MHKLPAMFAANFRSNFEAKICFDLQQAGIDYTDHYEKTRISYVVPARPAKYLPDLISKNGQLIIEIKGYLGDVQDRTKYVHFKECNPDIDLRFVLQRANVKIYKNSPTTQEVWLRSKGFKVAIQTIPAEWLEELTR